MSESKKRSLKSVALAVQQNKNEVTAKKVGNIKTFEGRVKWANVINNENTQKMLTWKNLKKHWWKTQRGSLKSKTGVF